MLLAKKYEEGTCTPEEKAAVETFFDKMQEHPSDIEYQLSDENGNMILNKILLGLEAKPKNIHLEKR